MNIIEDKVKEIKRNNYKKETKLINKKASFVQLQQQQPRQQKQFKRYIITNFHHQVIAETDTIRGRICLKLQIM